MDLFIADPQCKYAETQYNRRIEFAQHKRKFNVCSTETTRANAGSNVTPSQGDCIGNVPSITETHRTEAYLSRLYLLLKGVSIHLAEVLRQEQLSLLFEEDVASGVGIDQDAGGWPGARARRRFVSHISVETTGTAMRLGIFGGSFDPVHYGHLILAEQCREQCGLDAVWFLPAAAPPHKRDVELTSGQARVEMLELALAGHPQMSVSEIELERGGTSFTIETLRAIHGEDPSRELCFLIGADSLHDLHNWREPEGIAELATIAAVNRGDAPLPNVAALSEALPSSVLDRIEFVRMPGVDLSATDIRARIATGRSVRFMLPRAVEAYIESHGLYGSAGHTNE